VSWRGGGREGGGEGGMLPQVVGRGREGGREGGTHPFSSTAPQAHMQVVCIGMALKARPLW